MDITTLTEEELLALIVQANTLVSQRQQEEATKAENSRTAITQAVSTLDALIGDGVTTPNLTTIVGVQLYTDEQINDNAALAIRLLMQGLEITARTVRDVARVVGA